MAKLQFRRGSSFSSLDTSELFFKETDNTVNIGVGNDNYVVLAQLNSSNSGSFYTTGDISSSAAISASNIQVENNIYLKGSIFIGDNDQVDTLYISASLSGSLVPKTDSLFDIGRVDRRWNRAYFATASIGEMTIDGSGSFDSITVIGTSSLGYVQGVDDTMNGFSSSLDTRIISLREETGSYAKTNGDNLFSGSSQVNADTVTNFDTNVKDKLNEETVLSGSSQVDLTQTTNYNSGIIDVLNQETVISGSSQVNADTIINFDTNVKDKLNADNVISGSSQVDLTQTTNYSSGIVDILNSNTVISGSSQITITESQISDLDHYNSSDFDTDFSGKSTSNLTEGVNLYYTDTRVKTKLNTEGVISGSSQLTSSYDGRYATLAGGNTFTGTQVIDDDFLRIDSPAPRILLQEQLNFTFHSITATTTGFVFSSDSGNSSGNFTTSTKFEVDGDEIVRFYKDTVGIGTKFPDSNIILHVSGSTKFDGVSHQFTGSTSVLGDLSITGVSTFNDDVNIIGSGDLTLIGTASLNNNVRVGGTSTVIGDGVFESNVNITGDTEISSDLTTQGTASFNDDVSILGSGSISGDLDVGGKSTVTGVATFQDNVNIAGNNNITGDLDVQGTGSFAGNVVIAGNLSVFGSSSRVESVDLFIEDKVITLGSGSNTLLEADGSGFEISTTGRSFLYSQVIDGFRTDYAIEAGNGFIGDGSQITNVTASLVDYSNVANKPTLFSGSSQVNADTITNFDTNVKDKLNVEGVLSGSSQVTSTLQDITDNGNTTTNDILVNGGLVSSSRLEVSSDITGSGKFDLNFNGTKSIYIGTDAGFNGGSGINNVGIGYYSLYDIEGGAYNTAVGMTSLRNVTSGGHNTAIGKSSLFALTTGFNNSAVGFASLSKLIGGNNNVGIGYGAGMYQLGENPSLPFTTGNTSGENSIFIGQNTRVLTSSDTNQIVIGHNGQGKGSNTTRIGNSDTTHTYLEGIITGSSLEVDGAIIAGDYSNITITESQISDLSHYTSTDFDTDFSGKSTTDLTEGTNLYYTDARVKSKLDTEGIFSGSSQVNADTIQNFDINVKSKLDTDGVVSGSSQIDLTQTTNYSSGIVNILNTNTVVSGSSQVTGDLDSRYTLKNGENIVSSSAQLTESYDDRYAQSSSLYALTQSLGSVAYFNATGSINDDPFSIPTTQAVHNRLEELNAGDITDINSTEFYSSTNTGILHTGDGTASPTGSFFGKIGSVVMAIDTGSQHFTDGIKEKLNADGVISGSIATSDNYWLTDLSFNTGTGVLTATVTGSTNQTVDLDGRYLTDLSGQSTTNLSEGTNLYYTDNRVKTKLNTEGVISGSSQITITESQISDLSHYTHPTHPGDDFSVDTGALTGATVVSDIDINVTTDTEGHVTDANGVVSTRNLTLANLGYTGETNATADQTITAGTGLTGGGTGDITLNVDSTVARTNVSEIFDQNVTIDTWVYLYGGSGTGVLMNTISSGSIVISGGNTTSDGANISIGGSAGNNDLRVRIGTTEALRVASSGNLVVGKTTANRKFHVFDTNDGFIQVEGGTSTSVAALELKQEASGEVSAIVFDRYNGQYPVGAGSTKHGMNYISARSGFAQHNFMDEDGNLQMQILDNGVVNFPNGLSFDNGSTVLDDTNIARTNSSNTFTGDQTIQGNLVVTDRITAQEFHTEFVSSSVIYESGSTKFGDTADDIHSFTGSVEVEGSISATDYSNITITESQISDLTHYTDSDNTSHLNTLGVISGSSQVTITESQISDLSHYTTSDFDTDFGTKSTTDLTEGTNLYYTDGRVKTKLNTEGVISGSSQITITESQISDLDHYTTTDFNTDFSGKSTTDLTEGTNLYYTDSRVKTKLDTEQVLSGSFISNQSSPTVNSGSEEIVATLETGSYSAGFFDYYISDGTNMRAGTVYSVHLNGTVEFTETSTNDIGDTSGVVLSVDESGGNIRLKALTDTDTWNVKSLVRGI